MSNKINYLRSEVIGVLTQLDADKGKSTIRRLCNKALKQLSVREDLNEDPVGGNVSSLLDQVYSAIEDHNSKAGITVKAKADILTEYQAITEDPE